MKNIGQNDFTIPVFDTTRIHSQAIEEFALSQISGDSLKPDVSLSMKTKWVPWVLGALLLAASFLVEGAAFDIQLYDTYYVVGWASLLKGLGLVCFIAGGARLLRKRYSSQQS